jgi:predicted lipoprotein with Yx(FWY)xxD motif
MSSTLSDEDNKSRLKDGCSQDWPPYTMAGDAAARYF